MKFETTEEIIEADIDVIQLEITSKCNLKCKHCRGLDSKEIKNDMEFHMIKKIIDFACDNSENNSVSVVLSGGEPLLHRDFKEVLQYCADKNVRIEITTNGTLVSEEIIKLMKEIRVSGVSVSLDSYLEEQHDAFRGISGAYKKAINGIKKFVQNNISTNIRTTVSKNNYFEAEKMVRLAMSLGVNSVSFGPIMPVGQAKTMENEMFGSADEFEKFIEHIYMLKHKYREEIEVLIHECLANLYELQNNECDINSEEMIIEGCSAGITSFNVLINGDVTPCSMFHEKIFNIYNSERWKYDYESSPLIRELIERNYNGKCGVCEFKEYCGGCRVRAEYYNGSYLDSDPLCYVK